MSRRMTGEPRWWKFFSMVEGGVVVVLDRCRDPEPGRFDTEVQATGTGEERDRDGPSVM